MIRLKLYFLFICILALIFFACNSKKADVKEIFASAEQLMEINPDSAFALLDSVKFPEKLGEQIYNKYILLYIKAKDNSGRDISKDDLLILRAKDYYSTTSDTKAIAQANFYSGKVLYENGERNAIKYLLTAEKYAEKGDDTNLKGLIQHFIALTYAREADEKFEQQQTTPALANNHVAIQRFRNAISFFEKANKPQNTLYSYNCITLCFSREKNADSTLYYADKTLDISKRLNDYSIQSLAYFSVGEAYYGNNKKEEAKEYYREAIKLPMDSSLLGVTYISMANMFDEKTQTDSIDYYLDKATEVIKKIKYSDDYKKTYYVRLSKFLNGGQYYEKAFSIFSNYTKNLESRITKMNKKALMDMESKYKYEVMKNENNQLLIEKQSGMLSILALVLFIFIMCFVLYRRNIKRKEVLQQAHLKIFELKTMADTLEEEKNTFRGFVIQHFNILKKTAVIEGMLRDDEKKQNQKLLKRIYEVVYDQDSPDWDMILNMMSRLHDNFPEKLRSTYPQLDLSEFRICCLTYAGMLNNDISIVMRLTANTIQIKKTFIRKKLGIGSYGKIAEFLEEHVMKKAKEEEQQKQQKPAGQEKPNIDFWG